MHAAVSNFKDYSHDLPPGVEPFNQVEHTILWGMFAYEVCMVSSGVSAIHCL